MKVKITMEADVTDLPAFNCDTSLLYIRGAGRENVWDIIRDMNVNSIMKLMKAVAEGKDAPTDIQKAIILAYEDEKKLTDQFLASVEIEYIDEKPLDIPKNP